MFQFRSGEECMSAEQLGRSELDCRFIVQASFRLPQARILSSLNKKHEAMHADAPRGWLQEAATGMTLSPANRHPGQQSISLVLAPNT